MYGIPKINYQIMYGIAENESNISKNPHFYEGKGVSCNSGHRRPRLRNTVSN